MTEDLLSHYDCIQSITMPIYKQISKKNLSYYIAESKASAKLEKKPGEFRTGYTNQCLYL